MNTQNDNLDDVDLNEVFNDFYEKPELLLIDNDFKQDKIDDLVEFTETDCTSPSNPVRKRAKPARSKQTTMYDYATSVSFKYKEFYSSLDNTISAKTVTKGQKRPLTTDQCSMSTKKSKSSVDFIDNLLRYLDERSRHHSKTNF